MLGEARRLESSERLLHDAIFARMKRDDAQAAAALTVVGVRIEQVHLAYRLDSLRSERVRAQDRIRQLEIEVATLRSPSRIESKARQIGLVVAARDQIRLAKEYMAGGTGLAAAGRRAASLPVSRPPAQ